jgi:hypothetical protein
MEQPVYKPRLPVYGAEDGQQVLTSSGNIFEFNAEKNEWVCIGIMPDPDVVSLDNDGLVPPELHRKLVLVQELIEQGFDFSSFKLDTDVQDPYYYFFHSSDDLVKFSPEKCLDPKEVRVDTTVTEVIDNADGTSTVGVGATLGDDHAGLVLETFFCNYNIISNNDSSVIIDADKVNILSGDSVKIIKPEAMTTKLRIEVDKGRLYQKLVRNCCVGPKGAQGEQGDTGTSGDPAPDEFFQLPLGTTDGVFSWETVVETPIGTPLSLRIFREDNDEVAIIEVVQPLDDSSPMVIINDESIVVEETPFESSYNPTSKMFSGSLVVSQGGDDISTWRYKARQKGPKGRDGEDGNAFLEVMTSLLEDPSIRSTSALVSMRRGTIDGDLVIFQNTLFDNIPVSNLSASGGDPISDILKDEFAAVAVTVEEAKDIGFYRFEPKPFVAPPLDIPLWTPTDDCVQARRWSQYKFDWFNKTEPDYLFSIMLNPKPPEQCCQEDFFFCPNVGDSPCGITGEIIPPVPSPVECECECENPIASELSAGGLVLPPMDLLDPESFVSPSSQSVDPSGSEPQSQAEAQSQSPNVNTLDINVIGSGGSENLVDPEDIKAAMLNTVESVVDGAQNTFTQNIRLVGNGEIIVTLDYDADPCGGAAAERQLCAFVDSNAVRSFLTLEDRSGTSVISGGGVLEAQTIPSTMAFTVTGMRTEFTKDQTQEGESAESPGECITYSPGKILEPADLQLEININTTGVNYCRGYRVTITAVSDENTMICDPVETIVPTATKTMIGITGTGTQIPEDPRQDLPKPESIDVEATTFQDTPVSILLMPVNINVWAGGPVQGPTGSNQSPSPSPSPSP